MKKDVRSRMAQLPAGEKEEKGAVVEGNKRLTAASKKKSTRGRKRERMQISVRIDQAVMEIVYREMERRKKDEIRITDLIERGLILALREMGNLDPIYSQARLILNNEGVELARRVLKVAALSRFPEVRDLTALERCHREFHLATIDSVAGWPGYDAVCEKLGNALDATAR